jgi:hypothetical protein
MMKKITFFKKKEVEENLEKAKRGVEDWGELLKKF